MFTTVMEEENPITLGLGKESFNVRVIQTKQIHFIRVLDQIPNPEEEPLHLLSLYCSNPDFAVNTEISRYILCNLEKRIL